MLTLVWRIVSNDECDCTFSFSIKKLFLQPGKHAAWVLALAPDVPVERVACLCVDSNHSCAFRKRFTVEKRDWHSVVAILTELFVSFVCEPLLPELLEVVDFIIDTWS